MAEVKKLNEEQTGNIKAKRVSAKLRADDYAANSNVGVAATLRRLLSSNGEQDSLVVSIAFELGLDIIEGRLQPGDDLNSVDLAQRFSTSRTPAREALALLEKQGLVEVPAWRRPRVRGVSLAEIKNIYELRAAMHALACELVARRTTKEDLEVLGEKFEGMRRSAEDNNVRGYFLANMAFHDAVVNLCGNPLLQRSLDSLGLTTFNLRYRTLSQPHRIKQSLRDHELLMYAFKERNPTLAASIIRSNIHGALKMLEEQLEEPQQVSSKPGDEVAHKDWA